MRLSTILSTYKSYSVCCRSGLADATDFHHTTRTFDHSGEHSPEHRSRQYSVFKCRLEQFLHRSNKQHWGDSTSYMGPAGKRPVRSRRTSLEQRSTYALGRSFVCDSHPSAQLDVCGPASTVATGNAFHASVHASTVTIQESPHPTPGGGIKLPVLPPFLLSTQPSSSRR